MRFPVLARGDLGSTCPVCKAPAKTVVGPYTEYAVTSTLTNIDNPPTEVMLDNIRSIYNVGSFFRTADGAGVKHVHLCGTTPTPKNPRLAKTALGAQESVPWTYYRNGLAAARSLKDKGMRLWALEGGDESQPLPEALKNLPGTPIVLVVGNEISGVDPGILDICDKIFSIPMNGIKTSLNAAVSFGIAIYTLRFHCMNENC
jgi:23S rRNA (guanosine2251-2'-O)-methyltransferase